MSGARFRDRAGSPGGATTGSSEAVHARLRALNYSGCYPFMVTMRRLAMRSGGWLPTPRQITAIDRCLAHDDRVRVDPPPSEAAPLTRLQAAARERERRHLSGRL